MKKFFRSTGAKTLLCILISIFWGISVISATAAGLMFTYNFYNTKEETFLDEKRENVLIEACDDFVEAVLYGGEYFPEGEAGMQLVDSSGTVIGSAGQYTEDKTQDLYTVPVTMFSIYSAPIDYQISGEVGGVHPAGTTYYGIPDSSEEALGDLAEQYGCALIRFRGNLYFSSSEGYGICRDPKLAETMSVLEMYADTVKISVPKGSFVNEKERLYAHAIRVLASVKYAIFPTAVITALIGIALFVILICVSGRHGATGELKRGPLFGVPLDLLAVLAAGTCVAAAWILYHFVNHRASLYFAEWISVTLVTVVMVIPMILGLSMSFASRIKQHVLKDNLVIYSIWKLIVRFNRWIGEVIRSVPAVGTVTACYAAFAVIEVIFYFTVRWHFKVCLAFLVVRSVAAGCLLVYCAGMMQSLQKAGEALAGGDYAYRVRTEKLHWKFRTHGEQLNAISDGMAKAIENRLRSERMKTELITNVSHDLKTPLTSIISYTSLIAAEAKNAASETRSDDADRIKKTDTKAATDKDTEAKTSAESSVIEEYAEVLIRQSEKLKRLLEDLVEASKASTGNLEINLLPCDACVLVEQIEGEYEEKLEQAGLNLITEVPGEPAMIMADGRRMWRVFENLMNNIGKYSQSGTRVYLTLCAQEKEVEICFRNTSRERLNISADELTERFVRGDRSRSDGGNGLGLSIARTMTELQGGRFVIEIDGDLFKVTLTFPRLS